MNHYERLKVTQDAPPEVIRAAYRALANRLQAHPAAPGAAADAAQEEMMGLNAAYETLIDPMLRRDYDASLSPTQGWQKSADDDDGEGAASGDLPLVGATEAGGVELAAQRSAFAPEPNQVMLGTFIALLLIVLGFAWFYTRSSSSGSSMDASVVKQIGEQGSVSADSMEANLARPVASVFSGLHPLDGQGIELKSETLLKSAHALSSGRASAAQSDH